MNIFVAVQEEYRGAVCNMATYSSLKMAVDELKTIKPFKQDPTDFHIDELRNLGLAKRFGQSLPRAVFVACRLRQHTDPLTAQAD